MLGTVIVADKSKTVRRMVEIALVKHPFELAFAEDGAAAIQAARESSPAVAILGAGLSGVNGYEVAQQLKADAATQGTKVLLLVGKSAGFDAAQAGDAVDDHLINPFVTQQLVEKVFTAVGAEVPDGKVFKSSVLNIPLAKKPVVTPEEPPAVVAEPAPPPIAELPDTVAMDALPPMTEQAPPPMTEQAPPPVVDAAPPPPVEAAPPPPVEAAPPPPVEEAPAAEAAPPPVEEAPPPVEAPPPPATTDLAAEAVAQTAAAAAAAGVDAALAERIAWEVVPQLAEAILKEEIARVVRARLAG